MSFKFNDDGSVIFNRSTEVNDIYILINVATGQIHISEYPIGECVECGANCPPKSQHCDKCHHEMIEASELAYLEFIFNLNNN